jgi:hypothetical protein
MDATAVPSALADRLGPEATLGLIEFMDVAQRECVEMTMSQSTERFERRLVEETSKLRLEMHDGFAGLRLEIGALRQDMAAQKFDLLKWSFLFWIGQSLTVAGIVATMLR